MLDAPLWKAAVATVNVRLGSKLQSVTNNLAYCKNNNIQGKCFGLTLNKLERLSVASIFSLL